MISTDILNNMEEKLIKEIERWLDRYVNQECSKMEAVEGIDAVYKSKKSDGETIQQRTTDAG